jgi:hypothetical protein
MIRGVLRAALFASLVLTLWTFARPAAAMPAGLCDDRGATAIAPPPSLEAPDEAIARARAPASSCPCEGSEARAAIGPAHHRAPSPSPSAQSALPFSSVVLAPPAEHRLASAPVVDRPGRGVHSRVERPPRG